MPGHDDPSVYQLKHNRLWCFVYIGDGLMSRFSDGTLAVMDGRFVEVVTTMKRADVNLKGVLKQHETFMDGCMFVCP